MTDSEKKKQKQSPQVVHGPQTNIDGDVHGLVLSGVFNAPVILKNFLSEKVFKRLGLEQRAGFALLAVLIVGVGLGLYFALRLRQPTQMAGDFRIAVAGFAEKGKSRKSELGMQIAQDVYVHLEENFADMALDFRVTIWGPDQVGRIGGKDRDERAKAAEQIAESIGADIVVYGSVDTTNTLWQINPEFYVAIENFYEAEEVVGQYEIGAPFTVIGGSDARTRLEVNDNLAPRIEVLSRITAGLARYAFHHFELALETFKAAEAVEGIEEETGIKQVLYLLVGNAAGKSDDLKTSERYYLQAQELDPDYARVYAGLGNVRYVQAVDAYAEGMIETALTLLEESVSYYQRALSAPIRPALSDIESKVHFGLGRAYLMQAIISEGDMGRAAQELAWVVAEYDQNHAERLRERAAEAHKLLGLIYRLNGRDEQSIAEYEQAIALIQDIPQLRGKLVEYYAALGDEYVEAGQLVEATDAYRNAVQFAISPEAAEEYQDRLEQIEAQMEEL